MFVASNFVPNPPIDRRKMGVPVDRAVDIGHVKTGGQRHGLSVNVAAAGDDDIARAAAQRVAVRGRERSLEARC